jgi:N6-adenosine-specific RNA methylase IME4
MTKRAAALLRDNKELAEAVWKGDATLNQAEKQIRKRAAIAKVQQYKLPDGKFDVIVGDPPWEFDDELNGPMNRGLDYPTMTLDQICGLDIGKLASEDCALFLWTTKSHLLDGSAAKVCAAWGFVPKTIITWVKSNIGLGRYVRNRCEFIVVATRGQPVFDLSGETALKDDIIIQTGPRLRHSEKPDEAYARIEAICPSPRRLELNARKPRAGWVTSGSDLAPPAANGESVSALPAQANASAPRESPLPNAQSLSSPSGEGSLSPAEKAAIAGVSVAEVEFEENIIAGAAADPAHAANDTPLPDPESLKPVAEDELPF